jgi:hypothetical protein
MATASITEIERQGNLSFPLRGAFGPYLSPERGLRAPFFFGRMRVGIAPHERPRAWVAVEFSLRKDKSDLVYDDPQCQLCSWGGCHTKVICMLLDMGLRLDESQSHLALASQLSRSRSDCCQRRGTKQCASAYSTASSATKPSIIAMKT